MDYFHLQTDIQRTVKGWAETKVAVYPTWKKKIKNKTKTKKILSHHITRLFELKMSLGNQTGPHGNWSEHNEKKRREEL